VENGIREACLQIARHYHGERGLFAYEAFEHINATLFGGSLPWPHIVWGITPHSGCLGLTRSKGPGPVITLHRSILGGTEKPDPWGMDPRYLGVRYAYDVLIHESMHVKVEYVLGGWRGKGDTSHNNDLWIAEVNRLAPLLGISDVSAARTKSARLRTTEPDGTTRSVIGLANSGNVPFKAAVAGFPHGLRRVRGLLDYYLGNELPFCNGAAEPLQSRR
jgi:hypothetical protein